MTSGQLATTSIGFRDHLISNEELQAQLEKWAEQFPHLVRVSTIGQSEEGRPLWLLTLGPDPDRQRPSAWIDANMHASELSGTNVALALAEDILRLHLDPTFRLHNLPDHVLDRLRTVRFFILPRMCPDGADVVLKTGRYVRSNPRDRRPSTQPKWRMQDVNNDGVALLMRIEDPSGDFVESKNVPGVMVARQLEDDGPFYYVVPEGMIDNWDGHTIPKSLYLDDNDVDLNRNFPWSWVPEPKQFGAGSYATSEPESRAVVEFTSAHPEIFAWLNLHTFGGVYIRPPGHVPDKKMKYFDRAIFCQLEKWAEQYGGYPMVGGFEDFLYEPDTPLHGDLADYAYYQRGTIGFVCELWDLFKQVGISTKKPFSDTYTRLTREDIEAIALWDKKYNGGKAFPPWVKCDHPQLGTVEVGGVDIRVGLVNPTTEKLPEVCERQSAFFLRVAAMAPAVQFVSVNVQSTGETHVIEAIVANRGYLPTHILDEAKPLIWNLPVVAELSCAEGVTPLGNQNTQQEVGHLDGWGRGRFDGWDAPTFQRSRGNGSSAKIQWIVRGTGPVTIRLKAPRIGTIEHVVNVG